MLQTTLRGVCVLLVVAGGLAAQAQQNAEGRLPVTQYQEPFLLLIRDPLVQSELSLTPAQETSLQKLIEETDGPLLETRNQPADRGLQTTRDLIARSRAELATFLSPSQQTRLDQIELWTLGLRSLLRDEIGEKLKLSDAQQEKLAEAITTYQSEFQKLQQRAQAGEERAPLEKEHAESLKAAERKIRSALKPAQREEWISLMGEPLEGARLGFVKFHAPELRGTGPWLNSEPLQLDDLRGKVVVVHFWTFGCINCIHNYPSYHNWMRQFEGRDVVLVGVHTPETQGEFEVDRIRSKAAENNLSFPILVDNGKENWNAWGNSMWPTVYLVDKQGFVRYWWLGELNWQQNEGEKIMGGRIEELLRE